MTQRPNTAYRSLKVELCYINAPTQASSIHAAAVSPQVISFTSQPVVSTDMQQPIAAGESVKEQVVDTVPKRIKELKFGLLYV